MPYQKYARGLSVILLLFILYFFLEDEVAGWMVTIAGILGSLILAAGLLNAWFLYRAYRRGELFFVKNFTLFLTPLTLVVFPFLMSSGLAPVPWLFLYILLFYFATENLFRVRMDDVSLTVHTGFGQQQEIPLFTLRDIRLGEDFIEAGLEGGAQFRLRKGQFFATGWERLRKKLGELASRD